MGAGMAKHRVLHDPEWILPGALAQVRAVLRHGWERSTGELNKRSPATQEFAEKLPGVYRPLDPPRDLSRIFDADVTTFLHNGFQLIADDRQRRLPGMALREHGGRQYLTSDLARTAEGTSVRA